jgi:ubiquitin-protein ligase
MSGPGSTPRSRRLAADAAALEAAFGSHPQVTATLAAAPDGPPDAWRLVFRLRGVRLDARGQPAWADHHSVLLRLVDGYPRRPPVAVMETPLFHPNVGPRIGDEADPLVRWSPALSAPEVVCALAAVIQYQRFDPERPRNPVARNWALDNAHIFPVGRIDVAASLIR